MSHFTKNERNKVAIVGVGFVGSTTAYTLLLNGIVSSISLIDINENKTEGEALDLLHCTQFAHSVDINFGSSFELVKDASIVIICAGFPQKKDESRSELLTKNTLIFKDIIPKIIKYNKDCILLIVTNPLDVLTYISLYLSQFPSCKVLGTGTVLDTARLRYLLGSHFQVSPKDIIAHIIGEHGDSEFVLWSQATIAGVSLKEFSAYSKESLQKIYEKTKNAVYEIISKKGATYYAISLVITKIVRAVLLDQSRVFSVSSLCTKGTCGNKDDICISVPTIVRKSGVCEKLNLKFTQEEQNFFVTSANKIRKDIETAIKLL
jgi:L-lactate dehydrogenase